MRDIAPTTGRPTLNKPRARRDAAKVLAVALQTRYRRFLDSAGDENATVIATADLAQCMYENVEFILWALKHVGGMNPPPPEELRRPSAPQMLPPANDDPRFAKPPELKLEDPESLIDCGPGSGNTPEDQRNDFSNLPCTCPPLEHNIIGRDRHMTSCPKFVP